MHGRAAVEQFPEGRTPGVTWRFGRCTEPVGLAMIGGMARRRYSDEERAATLAALAANDGNLTRTAQQAGVPITTLLRWRDNPDSAAPSDLRNEKKDGLAALFNKVARAYL